VATIWALVAAPVAAAAGAIMLGSALLWIAGAAAIGMHVVFALFYYHEGRAEFASLLLFPAGILLISLMMLRAGFQCLRNNGIDWRGTHYALDELRAGQRIKFLRLPFTN
jgi:hypothetical protein